GQRHLGAHVPGVAGEHRLAVLEHRQVVAGQDGALDAGLGGGGGQPGQPAAAQVVVGLELLGAAGGLAGDPVGRGELAAAQQQADAVVVVLVGDGLVGALELRGRDAAVLGAGRGQDGGVVSHEAGPASGVPSRPPAPAGAAPAADTGAVTV